MVKIREAIVVEGRYDKNVLRQIVDAPILETEGFGIFKNKKQLAFLRQVAEKRGLIVFTDPDGAGFVIRNHIKSAIPKHLLKHAYTPDVFGKERRKTHAGKEGKLGVEGMTREVIIESLRRAGASLKKGSWRADRSFGVLRQHIFPALLPPMHRHRSLLRLAARA